MLENKQTKKNSVNNIELPDRGSHLLPCALKTNINIQKYGRPDFFALRKLYPKPPKEKLETFHMQLFE